DIAFRVIADHVRTLSFAISDGIQPGNTGRGYVLRRILRRAVKYGRSLGFHEPFFYRLVSVLAETMGHVFPDLRKEQLHVKEIIQREEEDFNETLDKGIELANEIATANEMVDVAISAVHALDKTTQYSEEDITRLRRKFRRFDECALSVLRSVLT